MPETNYFPGQDYPDREEWLKVRATPRKFTQCRVVYVCGKGGVPLNLSINATKRFLDSRKPAKRGGRQSLIRQRHAYYRRAA